MNDFTHFDDSGNAIMVDVSGKSETLRQATAQGFIKMSPECYELVKSGGIKKGDVLSVARVAGIMAVKKTSDLVPLCHTLVISKASIDFFFDDENTALASVCTVSCSGVTGVEMESLTGVSVALLTVYDMCKAVDKSMEIGGICLLQKTGGKSGEYNRAEQPSR